MVLHKKHVMWLVMMLIVMMVMQLMMLGVGWL